MFYIFTLVTISIAIFWVFRASMLKAYYPNTKERSRFASDEPHLAFFSNLKTLGSKTFGKELELINKTPEKLAAERWMTSIGVAIVSAGGAYLFLSTMFLYALPLLLGAVSWFIPGMSVKQKAANCRFEIWQAFSQFLSILSMTLRGGKDPSSGIFYAAHASDHYTFKHFQNLIPPTNSDKQFGEMLYEFGKDYDITELSDRGLIIRTTEREGGKNISDIITSQAEGCQSSLTRKAEEDVTAKASSASAMSILIIAGLMAFIMYPVVTSISTNPAEAGNNTIVEEVQAP